MNYGILFTTNPRYPRRFRACCRFTLPMDDDPLLINIPQSNNFIYEPCGSTLRHPWFGEQ
jgi:hypothetical protein